MTQLNGCFGGKRSLALDRFALRAQWWIARAIFQVGQQPLRGGVFERAGNFLGFGIDQIINHVHEPLVLRAQQQQAVQDCIGREAASR